MAGLDCGFIVVGFDATTESRAALRWALTRAAGMQAALKIVHCWPPAAFSGRRDWRDRRPAPHPRRVDAVRAVEQELSAAQQWVSSPPEVGMVFAASPVEPMLARQSRGAAMLVLGASSAAVLVDPSRGPVAGPLMDRLNCPVVVVDRIGRVTSARPRHPALGLVS